jgi:hypothetical protein
VWIRAVARPDSEGAVIKPILVSLAAKAPINLATFEKCSAGGQKNEQYR